MPYMLRLYDLRGNPVVRWCVDRNGAQYMFETYADANVYAKSHKVVK